MRSWQAELESHCSRCCMLNIIGWSESGKESPHMYIQVLGTEKSVLLIELSPEWTSGPGPRKYRIKKYTKNENGDVDMVVSYYDDLRAIHKELDFISSNFDISSFL